MSWLARFTKRMLHVEQDGAKRFTVATDESFRASEGPIRASDFLMGETYDARIEPRGDYPVFQFSHLLTRC